LLREKRPGIADGFGWRERGAAIAFAAEREVVVLDEDRVEQARAMIVPATAADGVLLEPPPAGRRLARVVKADFVLAIAAAYWFVTVATRSPGRAGSVDRSLVNRSRATPAIVATTDPAATASPSAAR
jgi:hypothetical protein